MFLRPGLLRESEHGTAGFDKDSRSEEDLFIYREGRVFSLNRRP